MVVLMCLYYGSSDKKSFVLRIDKFEFTLLPFLVINIKSVIKVRYPPKVMQYIQKSYTILTAYHTIVLIAGSIFCTAFWTLVDHVPLLSDQVLT